MGHISSIGVQTPQIFKIVLCLVLINSGILAVFPHWGQEAYLVGDSETYFELAETLYQSGSIADFVGAENSYTAKREPLYIWLLSQSFRIQGVSQVPPVYLNLAITLMLSIACFFSIRVLTGNLFLATVFGFIAALVPQRLGHSAFAMPEYLTALLLCVSSLTLLLCVRKQHIGYYALLGGVVGLLILARASFLYIAAGGLVALLVYQIFVAGDSFGEMIRKAGLSVLVAAIIVSPWMLRNYHAMGKFIVAERGGSVLLIRAVYNDMSWNEFINGFLFFNPFLKHLAEDSGDSGSSSYKLDRKNSDSYYSIAKSLEYEGLIVDGELWTEDDIRFKNALDRIFENPLAHIRNTLLFVYRGLAPQKGLRIGYPYWFGLGFMFLLIVVWAVFTRKFEFLVFLSLTILYVGFYGLFTHYIPRYSAPLMPMFVISVSYGLERTRKQVLTLVKKGSES